MITKYPNVDNTPPYPESLSIQQDEYERVILYILYSNILVL